MGNPSPAGRSLAESGTTMQTADAGLGKAGSLAAIWDFNVALSQCTFALVCIEPSARQSPS